MTPFATLAFFLTAFCAACHLAATLRVYALWTGGAERWPVLVPALLLGLGGGWLADRAARRVVGPKCCALLAVAASLALFWTFGDTEWLVKNWTLLSLRIGLTYEAWHGFVVRQAVAWFAPACLLLPFCLRVVREPRGRLVLLAGVCLGFAAGRFLAGRVATVLLLDWALGGMMVASGLWLAAGFRSRWARSLAAVVPALLFAGWYLLSCRTPHELIGGVNPFATVAAADERYLGTGAAGVALRDGRLVETVGLDEAARTASQLLPLLLKPAPAARIAARPQAGAPRFPSCAAGTLQGRYDALWVALPPAWHAGEAAYFGSNALKTAEEHLLENGVLVYELDARALDARMVMARVAQLRKRFPHVQLWMTGLNQWQLVASRQPIYADFGAMDSLLDRAEVADALADAGIPAPVYLLSSCVFADAGAALDALDEPLPARLPGGEARHARRLLFDGLGARRMFADFARVYEPDMPWVRLPPANDAELRSVLSALRAARLALLEGRLRDASEGNAYDPVLQAFADRELGTARDAEKLAEHDRALGFYANAFALAQPRVETVLEAAAVAQSTGAPARAEPFYRLAGALAPDDPGYIVQYAGFLFENRRFDEAERVARQLLPLVERDAIHPQTRFFLARCVANQPSREEEGLRIARAIAAQAATPEEKGVYIPAYGQLLIDLGRFEAGLKVKRGYKETGELLPEEAEAGK